VSYHLTYLQAVVTGLVQGVTELFPVSSLGHNVLLPALIGGSWAKTLNVSATGSPYLAFIVGLHVATAIAMIAFFWRDWLRIVRGFFSSIGQRRIATPDQRLAWMIILGTIPVGIVGVVLQKEVTKVLAKPELAAAFLAINGVILLVSERMRRAREARGAGPTDVASAAPRPAFDGPAGGPGYGPPGGPGYGPAGGPGYGPAGGPGYGPPQGYQQQPRQQQWQGPDPRYGRDDWQQPQNRDGNENGNRQRGGRHSSGNGQGGQHGRDQYGQGQDQYGRDPRGGQQPQQPRQPQQPAGGAGYPQRPEYGQEQWGGQQAPGVDPRAQQGADPRDPRGGWDQRDPRGPRDQRAPQGPRQQQSGGRHGGAAGQPRAAAGGAETDPAVAADRRLSTITLGRAVTIGAAQILALLPGISRDGIVTVAGMERGLRREDAVRFSFLLSAPVILAAGALKMHDLTGPASKGMHGPIIVGSLIAGIGAYVSIRFLTKYFSEDKSLNPFGFYCIIAGLGSLAYLVLK
jgi:undecaprenyl pyrophosphate phosphatase UppP